MTTTAAIRYSHTVGSLSNQGRGFQNPVDVALDSQGVMYVLNRAGPELPIRMPYKRVSMCTVDEEFLGEFSTGGTDAGELWWPSSLAFDSQDRLYVADEALNRITVFSTTGEVLDIWGEEGSVPGQIDHPSYIACDADDHLLIADSGNHRVQKFTTRGEFIESWGALGDGEGRFNAPWGIALDAEGTVYVSDWGNNRIQKLTPNGDFIEQLPRAGAAQAEDDRIRHPAGLCVDREGIIYVADWGNERVRLLSPSGELLATLRGESETPSWANEYFEANPEEGALRLESDLSPLVDLPGGFGTTSDREESANVEKLLWGPMAVKVDGQGNILIVDSCRHRIQVYRRAQ